MYVAGFVGEANVMPATLAASGVEEAIVALSSGARMPCRPTSETVGGRVNVVVRPEKIVFAEGEGLAGTVEEVVFLGSSWKFVVRLSEGSEVIVTEPNRADPAGLPRVGQSVALRWQARDAWVAPGPGMDTSSQTAR